MLAFAWIFPAGIGKPQRAFRNVLGGFGHGRSMKKAEEQEGGK